MKPLLLLLLCLQAQAESLEFEEKPYMFIRGNWVTIFPHLKLTVAHNVDTKKSIIVDGKESKRLEINTDIDLAVLSTEDIDAVKIANKDAPVGTKVYVYGSYRNEKKERKEHGKVKQIFDQGQAKTLLDLEIDHGLSGSPVYNEKDELVGIISCGYPHHDKEKREKGEMEPRKALMVPISVIKTFMEGAGLWKKQP